MLNDAVVYVKRRRPYRRRRFRGGSPPYLTGEPLRARVPVRTGRGPLDHRDWNARFSALDFETGLLNV